MIAKVKIAPVERWCSKPLKSAADAGGNPAGNVGKLVAIHTETMRQSEWCDGRVWDMQDSGVDEFRAQAGLGPRRHNFSTRIICEHMLEMD